MGKVILLLLANGYVPDGVTQGETFRIVTKQSYPLPGAEISTGGRQRFVLPGTLKRVTVGKRVVSFYTCELSTAKNFKNFETKGLEGIESYLKEDAL